MKKALTLYLILSGISVFAQKKTLVTKFTSENITIDGKFLEKSWDTAAIATDFIMFEPDNGKAVDPAKKSEFRVVYDNDAIYIAAKLFDDEPTKILKEIAARDNLGAADFMGVSINGYNDGQQDYRFFVSASDGQLDCLGSNDGEDFSWDAVWKSKAVFTSYGWAVEMRIPYAALRFPADKIQTWGINFIRNIKYNRQTFAWNPIDNKAGTFTQQAGILTGIENIKTPTRLFLLPYTSFYTNANAFEKTKGSINLGMDIKYGINDAFTLDAILIPDFGQTALDQKILNLGPFEQQFNENRAFFTEGTDLFSKGNLLYSRRIGAEPIAQADPTTDEEVVVNPLKTNLLNATKVSGRTKSGLGIGILNAITENTFAIVRNTITGIERKVLIDPISNYNVLVLDQRFQKNSSVSLVNTNVIRDGGFRDANVSALVWDLNTKANTYKFAGDFKYSYVFDNQAKTGLSSNLELSETEGKWRSSIGAEFIGQNYDNNDLGINNEIGYSKYFGNLNFRTLQSTKKLNSFFWNLNAAIGFQNETGKIVGNGINMNARLSTKKNLFFGTGINFNIFKNYDYYQARSVGRYFITPKNFSLWTYISTDFNKKFAIDLNPYIDITSNKSQDGFGLNINPRYRFSNQFAMNYRFNFDKQLNDKGFAAFMDLDNDPNTAYDIVFGNREILSYSNALTGKYSVNSKMNFDLTVRHYWSFVENSYFLKLETNGNLTEINQKYSNLNQDFSLWNFDLSYNYWFAPGSQIIMLYRNNSGNYNNQINKNFGDNFSNLLNNNVLNHNFSISIKYFIDYNQAKHWF